MVQVCSLAFLFLYVTSLPLDWELPGRKLSSFPRSSPHTVLHTWVVVNEEDGWGKEGRNTKKGTTFLSQVEGDITWETGMENSGCQGQRGRRQLRSDEDGRKVRIRGGEELKARPGEGH